MSEIEQLKKRITDSNYDGIATAIIRDDYEPVGAIMIHKLCDTDEFVSRRVMDREGLESEWKVFATGFKPH